MPHHKAAGSNSIATAVLACEYPFVFHIGDVIRKLRKDLGLSVQQLAERAKVNKGTLSAIERGDSNFRRETLARIAKALNTTTTRLFGVLEDALRHQTDAEIADLQPKLEVISTQFERPAAFELFLLCAQLNDVAIQRLLEDARLMLLSERFRVTEDPTEKLVRKKGHP
jgi:transcriptional regulator with XRE-family HTH domain